MQKAVTEEKENSMLHELKIHPEHFIEVYLNNKKIELRKNDRNFLKGDLLLLKEYNPDTQSYTGKSVVRIITHVLKDVQGLEKDFVILSIRI